MFYVYILRYVCHIMVSRYYNFKPLNNDLPEQEYHTIPLTKKHNDGYMMQWNTLAAVVYYCRTYALAKFERKCLITRRC